MQATDSIRRVLMCPKTVLNIVAVRASEDHDGMLSVANMVLQKTISAENGKAADRANAPFAGVHVCSYI